jgi:hypothetical protein
MAGVVVRLTTEGFERFQRVLKDPQFVGKPRSELLFRARSAGLKAAREPLKGRGMHGVSHISAYQSMRAFADIPRGMVTVSSLMPPWRTEAIERGRSPGTLPAITPIARWALRRPALTRRRISELTPDEGLQVSRARRTIAARGVPGKGMFAAANQRWRSDMPRWLDDMAKRLEARWGVAA